MNAADKAAKLLTLARDPAATPGEADLARHLAREICNKFGVRPTEPVQPRSAFARTLTGKVAPDWRRPAPPWGSEQRQGIFRRAPESDLSGISTEEARHMALDVLVAAQNGQYLQADEEDLVRGAFDGLLTDFGKILLMGLHTIVIGV